MRVKMRVAGPIVCMFAAMIFLASGRVLAQGVAKIDAEWVAKGNSDGATRLAKYQAILDSLDETSETRYEPEVGGVRTTKLRSVRLGEDTLLEKERHHVDSSRQPLISLACDNHDYYFVLQKSKLSSPFAMTEYAPGARKLPLWRQGGSLHAQVYYQLNEVIESLAPANRENLRSIHFDSATGLLTIEKAGVRKNRPFTHKFTIDPARGWIIKSSQSNNSMIISTGEFTYGEVIDGLTFPTGAVMSFTSTDKIPGLPETSRTVVRVLKIKRTEMTSADFRLSAFGFPEPAGVAVPPRPTRWYIWILLAAAVCAILAFGFTYLRRRLSARRAALPGGST